MKNLFEAVEWFADWLLFLLLWLMRFIISTTLLFIVITLSASAMAKAPGQAGIPADRPPNLIWVMADDLGWAELGCYGQKVIKTPEIDRMADEGLRFTHYYAGATVCAPSRSVLITGQHHGRTRVRGNAGRSQSLAIQALQPGDPSVASVLKEAGYRTALMGKWGLGDIGEAEMGLPSKHGFDEFFGFLNQRHAHNHFTDFLWRNGEKIKLPNTVIPVGGDSGAGYSTDQVMFADDVIADEALKFVSQNQDQPFFLYWSMIIPHANNERTQKLGDGANVPDYGPYETKDWSNPDKGQAAMITRMDSYLGRLMDHLKLLGIADNTLVIFTSDNGPHDESNHNLERFDPNGPFSGIKRDLTDGGIRIPFIAWWPGTVKPGVTDHAGYFADWMPTAADFAGVEVESETDGISIAPLLLGHKKKQETHEFMYWEFPHHRGFKQVALYDGRWKGFRTGGPDTPVRIYDLDQDTAEEIDVASKYPEIAEKISDYLKTARKSDSNWPAKW